MNLYSSIKEPIFIARLVQLVLGIVPYALFSANYSDISQAFTYTTSDVEAILRFTIGLTGIVFFPIVVTPINIFFALFYRQNQQNATVLLLEAAGVICYLSTGMILAISAAKAEFTASVGTAGGFCILTALVYAAVLWHCINKKIQASLM